MKQTRPTHPKNKEQAKRIHPIPAQKTKTRPNPHHHHKQQQQQQQHRPNKKQDINKHDTLSSSQTTHPPHNNNPTKGPPPRRGAERTLQIGTPRIKPETGDPDLALLCSVPAARPRDDLGAALGRGVDYVALTASSNHKSVTAPTWTPSLNSRRSDGMPEVSSVTCSAPRRESAAPCARGPLPRRAGRPRSPLPPRRPPWCC